MRQTRFTHHLDNDELLRRYQSATNPKYRERWHLIWLVQSEGYSVVGASEIVGHARNWGHHWIHLYSDSGPDSIEVVNRGGWIPPKQKLDKPLRQKIYKALVEAVPEDLWGSEWTGPLVADYVESRFQIGIGRDTGWRLLREAGLTRQTPRPHHAKASKEAQETFKKTLPEIVRELRTLNPKSRFSLWFMDEARLGLQPILGRRWSPRGIRPVVRVHPRYQWQYVFAGVNVESGQTSSLILPAVNIEMMQLWLDEFAADLAPDELRLLVLDGAGWHSKTGLKWPVGVLPVWLPPYSPELNPAERLWTLLRKRLANRRFDDIDDLTEQILVAIKTWIDNPEKLVSTVSYSWIKELLVHE